MDNQEMMTTKETPIPVFVLWRDICGNEKPWVDLEEAKGIDTILMQTLGWLIEQSEDRVVIAGTLSRPGVDQDELAGNLNAIPTGCIQDLIFIDDLALRAI